VILAAEMRNGRHKDRGLLNNSGSYLFITLCCMHELATRYCLRYRVSKFIIYADFYISLINRGALALVEYIAMGVCSF